MKNKKSRWLLLILLCFFAFSTQSTYAQDLKPRAVVIEMKKLFFNINTGEHLTSVLHTMGKRLLRHL